jgi:hypothetical protein
VDVFPLKAKNVTAIEQHERKITRRAFAIGGAALLVGSYLVGRQLGSFNRSPHADFTYVVPDRLPKASLECRTRLRTAKYIAPNSGEEILLYNTSTDSDDSSLECVFFLDDQLVNSSTRVFDGSEPPVLYSGTLSAGEHRVKLKVEEKERLVNFLNRSTDPDTELPALVREILGATDEPAYAWFTNDRKISTVRDCSSKLIVGESTVRLQVRDGGKHDSVEKTINVPPQSMRTSFDTSIVVDPEISPQYQPCKFRVPIKGINYGVGIRQWGSYPTPSKEQMSEELTVIRDELGCNAVKLYGNNDDAMLQAAHLVASMDFEAIALSPRYIDATVEETINFFGSFVTQMGDLMQDNRVLLVLGNELTYDSRGWIDAPTYSQRVYDPQERHLKNQDRLNALLSSLRDLVPEDFRGRTTYARGSWEQVDWKKLKLDVVGSNEYWRCKDERYYLQKLAGLRQLGKPVYVMEFGAATYEGVCGDGSGWALYEGKKYSEESQTGLLRRMLDCINKARMDGCFLWDFASKKGDPRGSTSITNNGRRKLSFYLYKSYRRTA